MKTVAAIYTAQALIDPIKALFAELVPGHRLINIFDDSLIADVVRAGNRMTTDVKRRMLAYCRACEDMEVDLLLNTCSSMGDVVDQLRPFLSTPLLKIDEAMMRRALEMGSSIAVMMTNPTTRVPSLGLLRRIADEAGKPVDIVEGMAAGAFQALVDGHPERHNELLFEAALGVAERADVIVLAQGSMAPLQDAIAQATGKPVLSSPRLGLLALRERLADAP